MIFAFDRTDERLTLRRRETRWLSNGIVGGEGGATGEGGDGVHEASDRPRGRSAPEASGGYVIADATHNLTVPTGFDRTDLPSYVAERLGDAPPGPALLTGVSQTHARGARLGPVEVVVTVGLSNPAVLPMDAAGEGRQSRGVDEPQEGTPDPGTANVFVGTDRALADGALVGLLATAVEAKAATLLDAAGVPGTTSDAVVVGCDPTGEPAAFAGSATEVGAAARVCVREAIQASLSSRYGDAGPPDPGAVEHGVTSADRAEVFDPE